jgi:hypothetical protein
MEYDFERQPNTKQTASTLEARCSTEPTRGHVFKSRSFTLAF